MFPIETYIQKDDEGIDQILNCEIPFNSTNKFHLLIWNMSKAVEKRDLFDKAWRNKMVVMQGAPEWIWSWCNWILINGEEIEITEDITKLFNEANKQFGG